MLTAKIQFRDAPHWVWQWIMSQSWFDEFSHIIKELAFEQSTVNAFEILQHGVEYVQSTGSDALSLVDGRLWITVHITPDVLFLILQDPVVDK